MADTRDLHFASKCIHGRDVPGDSSRGIAPPIHMASSFSFESIAHAEEVMDFRSADYVYTRGNNPTLRLFETKMAELEGGSAAVAFASGMAAISTVLLSILQPGERLLTHTTLYGSSHTVVSTLLPRYGISTIRAELFSTEAVEAAFSENGLIRAVFFETPANPTLDMIDIAAVAEIAHRHGAIVVVDNTFATPFLQKPLQCGADIVVHSATKYINGHGDALGGVAVTGDSGYGFTLKFDYMCELGGVMSPFNAWLMLRGIKTLPLRMERHCSNAAAVADFLAGHPAVVSVRYPGLPGSTGSDLIPRQMLLGGGMISFEVRGGLEAAVRCIDALQYITTAVSLGDCETLIQLPAAITHRGYDRSELQAFGLSESMIRISVGLEHVDDIIRDLDQALSRI